jgi:two-component system response regulator AlgR
MLNIILIDDEPLARSRLKRLLEEVGHCEIIGEGGSGEDAIRLAGELRPDLIFMDIRMPGLDGLEAAHRIRNMDPTPVVVFCTAYDEHALTAFDEDAVDYLVKPVRRDRLGKSLDKVRKFLGINEDDNLRHYLRSKVGDRVELIPVDRVIYLLAEHKYTTVVYDQGTAVIDDTLKSLIEEFSGRFFRIHRNALVATSHLRGLVKDAEGQIRVTLKGTDADLEVSRRNLPGLRKLIRKL